LSAAAKRHLIGLANELRDASRVAGMNNPAPNATFIPVTRADLHRLVDDLPDESVDAAGVLLTRARDPMVAALEAAPFDDEPYTEDDRAASDEGWAAYQRGEAIKVGELRAEPEPDA
jgi:hypothetical protein